MIPLGILASSVRRASSGALLSPTDLVATLVEPSAPLPTVIGEAYGGGFYAGDIEYPDGQWYKLIVADKTADISGSDSRWKTENTLTIGTDSMSDGLANTTAMLFAGGSLHPAATHCSSHSAGDSSDWYMPSRDEMVKIRSTLGPYASTAPPAFKDTGQQCFESSYYRLSTQNNITTCKVLQMVQGYEGQDSKNSTTGRVRPVRRIAFTPD